MSLRREWYAGHRSFEEVRSFLSLLAQYANGRLTNLFYEDAYLEEPQRRSWRELCRGFMSLSRKAKMFLGIGVIGLVLVSGFASWLGRLIMLHTLWPGIKLLWSHPRTLQGVDLWSHRQIVWGPHGRPQNLASAAWALTLFLTVQLLLGLAESAFGVVFRRDAASLRRWVLVAVVTSYIVSFLLTFSWYHWIVSNVNPHAYRGGPFTKITALYFTATILTTTGFGDIAPISDGARLLVTVQMLWGVLILLILLAGLVSRFSSNRD